MKERLRVKVVVKSLVKVGEVMLQFKRGIIKFECSSAAERTLFGFGN